jgi:tRNA(Arg) A34 adenosine deaminase TadA
MNGLDAVERKYGSGIMRHCMLLTTAEPCVGCSYYLDKANVGMVIVAASREDAPDFFRKRDITIDNIWGESRRKLTLVRGLRKVEAAELLTADTKRH